MRSGTAVRGPDFSTGLRTGGQWGVRGRGRGCPSTGGFHSVRCLGQEGGRFTDATKEGLEGSMMCTEGTYGEEAYSTECFTGGVELCAPQPELLSPRNPLVLLALVLHENRTVQLQEQGHLCSASPQQQQQQQQRTEGESVSAKLCPLLVQEEGVQVCPPLPLPSDLAGVGACAVRGPHCVVVGQRGEVVVWDVVEGGAVWGVSCELGLQFDAEGGFEGQVKSGLQDGGRLGRGKGDGGRGMLAVQGGGGREEGGGVAGGSAKRRGRGKRRGSGGRSGAKGRKGEKLGEEEVGDGGSQQQQGQVCQHHGNGRLGMGEARSMAPFPAAAVFCRDGMVCAAVGSMLMLCCWE